MIFNLNFCSVKVKNRGLRPSERIQCAPYNATHNKKQRGKSPTVKFHYASLLLPAAKPRFLKFQPSLSHCSTIAQLLLSHHSAIVLQLLLHCFPRRSCSSLSLPNRKLIPRFPNYAKPPGHRHCRRTSQAFCSYSCYRPHSSG